MALVYDAAGSMQQRGRGAQRLARRGPRSALTSRA